MVKSFTATHLAETLEQRGSEPIIIVRIEWDHIATTYYSSRPATMGGGSCTEAIISMSPLTYQERDDGLGVIGSINFVMDDTTGHFKARYGNETFEKVICTVYHSYAGFNHDVDAEELFKGKIGGGITWIEGSRLFNMTVEDNVFTDEVGYTLEEDDALITGTIFRGSYGKDLPLCFGDVVRVPAIKLHGGAVGKIKDVIDFEDYFDLDATNPEVLSLRINNGAGYNADDTALTVDSADNVTVTTGSWMKMDATNEYYFITAVTGSPTTAIEIRPGLEFDIDDNDTFTVYPMNSFSVEDGELFPQDSIISISIAGILFKGIMHEDRFYCEKNLPTMPTETTDNVNAAYYENVAFLVRSVTSDAANKRVAWITANTDLSGKFCYIKKGSKYFINKCIKQVGTKCWFLYDWEDPVARATALLVDDTYMLVEACGEVPTRWTLADFYFASDLSLVPDEVDPTIGTIQIKFKTYEKDSWELEKNMKVYEITVANTVYIPNILPSTSVCEVYGHREVKVDGEAANEIKKTIFTAVPSSHYTVQLAKDYGVGDDWTGIEFTTPLEARLGEGWIGDVYISLTSSEGPNSIDIIKWFIDTYTSYTMSAADFSSEEPKLEPYPANFMLTTRESAMKLISEIAWQSRCALWLRNDLVYVKYLSKRPETTYDITPTNTELQTMACATTPIVDVKTEITATWVEDYSLEHRNDEKKKAHRLTKNELINELKYINNTDEYGVQKEEINFWIYNNESCVKRSLFYWGYRKSNVWRIITTSNFLELLRNDVYDFSNYIIGEFSPYAIRGIITNIKHDVIEQRIGIESILASKPGDVFIATTDPVEDSDFWTGDPAFPCNINDNKPASLLYGRGRSTRSIVTSLPLMGDWTEARHGAIFYQRNEHTERTLERVARKRLLDEAV